MAVMPRTPTLLLALMLLMICRGAVADDDPDRGPPEFRVLIRVHDVGGGEAETAEPLSEHEILFRGGVVYDLTRVPKSLARFVTVFDPEESRVVLLDRQSMVRSTVSTDNLIELTAKARAATEDPARREALGMMAAAQADASGERYTIRFGRVAYETGTQRPEDPNVARAFGRFSDWAARLNIARKVNAPPPFARMTLNQTLAIGGQMPDTMTVTVRQDAGEARYRVEHQLTESLSEAERKQIQKIRGMFAAYRDVPFKSFPK